MSQKAHANSLFAAVARFGTKRPKLVLAIVGITTVAALLLIVGLRVSTSRHGLVSAENAYQARVVRFLDKFGYPDAPVLVVSGATPEARRRTIDRMTTALETTAGLDGRVLGHIGPQEVAEVLVLQRPAMLSELSARLGEGGGFAPLIESGLPGWTAALDASLAAGLDGAGDPKDAEAGLARLAVMFEALRDELAGENGAARLTSLGDAGPGRQHEGVDELGYLVGARGNQHLLAMFPDLPGDEGSDVQPMVEQIRKVRDEVLAAHPEPGIEAQLTGLPALASDELTSVKWGLFETSLVSTGAIFLILLLAFRSLRFGIMSLVPLGVGTITTLGAVRLMFGELNLITASFVSVLLGLGIDFGIHLLSRYGELMREGEASEDAIQGSLALSAPGLLTGALTTIAAFLTTTTTDFTAFAQLGVITSVGLLLMLIAAFALMPALVRIGGGAKLGRAPELPLLGRLAPFVSKARYPILALAAVGAVLGARSVTELSFNGRYFDFLPAGTESAIGLAKIEADGAMSPAVANFAVKSVEEARARAAELRALPSVARVETPSDMLPPLTPVDLAALRDGLTALGPMPSFDKLRARETTAADLLPKLTALSDTLDEVAFSLRQSGRATEGVDGAKKALAALKKQLEALPEGGKPALHRIESKVAGALSRALTTARAVADRGMYAPSDLPASFRSRFASRDGTELALFVYPRGDIWDHDVARAFTADMEKVDPEVAGLAVTIYEHERMVLDGFEKAAAVAIGLVLLLLLASFRNVKDAALALCPLLIGWVWTFGAMQLASVTFNWANIVVLPLLLGLGVDAGAHMMHRCRESAAEHGGVASADDILRGTGGAVMLASLTTMAGFAALMVADYGGMKSLGLVMTLGMASCLLASVVVLPAILIVVKRAK